MAAHSAIVGGSTAKRVINCPGSVALCAKAPPKTSSDAADEGTLCHLAMEMILDQKVDRPEQVIGLTYKKHELTDDLYHTLILPALTAVDTVIGESELEYVTEGEVSFGDRLPGVFGSTDLIGRRDKTAVILDYKFGADPVPAEESPQGLFYTAAARHTPKFSWVFDGAEDVEIVMVQPKLGQPLTRWRTTFERVAQFETTLIAAVKQSEMPDAPLQDGPWCKYCAGKPFCPIMTGAIDRLQQASLANVDGEKLAEYMMLAARVEAWMKDAWPLAQAMLEAGRPVPGYKLVNKKATRKWRDEKSVITAVTGLGFPEEELYERSLRSPAQMEKLLKPKKLELPPDLVASVSSGTTVVEESDPRPAAILLSGQLSAALSKLQ